MTKTIQILLFIVLANGASAQKQVLDSTNQKEMYFPVCNSEKALKDIKNGMIKIILPGGFVAASELPGDAAFEEKYGISFFSQGCVRFAGDNESAYNQEVFKYLDEKLGKDWRSEIRTDAIGLKAYLK